MQRNDGKSRKEPISRMDPSLTAADNVGESVGLLVGAVLIEGLAVGFELIVGDDVVVGPAEGFEEIVGATETVGEAEGESLGLDVGTSLGDTVAVIYNARLEQVLQIHTLFKG